jgi:hypothetical protein
MPHGLVHGLRFHSGCCPGEIIAELLYHRRQSMLGAGRCTESV